MRRLLVLLAVVVGLLVVLDVAARFFVEGWLSGQVRAALAMDQAPSVSLGPPPLLPQILRGRLSVVHVRADAVTTDALRVERLDLELRSVRFPVGTMLARSGGTVRIRRGTGTATVTDTDLTAYLAFQGFAGRVKFGEGEAIVDGKLPGGAVVTATGPLIVNGRALVFEPRTATSGGITIPVGGLGLAFSYELPAPFPGLSYDRIRVRPGRATVDVSVKDAEVAVGAS